MIKLSDQFQTKASSTFNGATTETVTDSLFVSDVRIDFAAGTIVAMLQKGYVPAEYPDVFRQTLDAITVTVNKDGSFVSSDGLWSGTIKELPVFFGSLKTAFDQFVLASGQVIGAIV